MSELFLLWHVLSTEGDFNKQICDTVAENLIIKYFSIDGDGDISFKAEYWSDDKYYYFDTFPDERRILDESVAVFTNTFIIPLVDRVVVKGSTGMVV